MQGGQDASDLGIGVGEEAGKDFLLAGVHPSFVGAEIIPSLDPAGPWGEHGVLGHDPGRPLTGEDLLAPGVPALVEFPAVGRNPLGRHMMGCVHGAQGEVQEEGFRGVRHLALADHRDRPVREVVGEVVAVGIAVDLDDVVRVEGYGALDRHVAGRIERERESMWVAPKSGDGHSEPGEAGRGRATRKAKEM